MLQKHHVQTSVGIFEENVESGFVFKQDLAPVIALIHLKGIN